MLFLRRAVQDRSENWNSGFWICQTRSIQWFQSGEKEVEPADLSGRSGRGHHLFSSRGAPQTPPFSKLNI